MTVDRRRFMQGAASAAASLLAGRSAAAADGDPARIIQDHIDQIARQERQASGMHAAIVVGIVPPDGAGQLLFAGQDGLVNPLGERLTLDAQTPFEIGSISKVFTSGIHYMMHGPYEGTLRSAIGRRLPLSNEVGELRLDNLARYQPGLAQDNHGGVYPRNMTENLRTLFEYMADFSPPYAQGSCYAYSNIGWTLLSMASLGIDSLDTEAFVEAYERRLKQFCTGFEAPGTTVFRPWLKPRLPVAYNVRGGRLGPDNSYQPSDPPRKGAGGIVSNGADMLRFLLFNMGRLPERRSDAALAYQQTETFEAGACGGDGPAPVTSYGWFHSPFRTPQGSATVLNKNGGVPGFTSWMGFTRWQGTGGPSTHGLFVLSNGHHSTPIGTRMMRVLLEG